LGASKKYRHRLYVGFNFEQDRIKEFEDLCWRERKTMSDKLNEMISEQLEKNAVGLNNPIKISYGETNKDNHKDCWRNNLDQWIPIDSQEAREMISSLPKEQLPVIYANTRKLKQQLDLKMSGKIILD
jgi:hypothetical protein